MLARMIAAGDVGPMSAVLYQRKELANELIAFGPKGEHRVPPLHFVCDCVFEGVLKEWMALDVVKLLVEQGADLNGNDKATTKDTPLIAACSLYCESIALYLIDQGAETARRGTHGGTCLHWAAWTGSDKIVKRLIEKKMPLNDQGDDFKSTPLLWAINGWHHDNPRNHRKPGGSHPIIAGSRRGPGGGGWGG